MPLAFANPYRVPKAPFNPWGLDPRQAQQAWTGAPSAGAAAAVNWQPPPGAIRETPVTPAAQTPLFTAALGGRPAANRPWGVPPPAATMPTLGFGALRPETQAAIQSAYGRQPAGAQATLAGQYARGGLFGGVYPALGMGGAGPEWGDLTPDVQGQVMAAYQALDPARQATVREQFASGGLAAAVPWLQGAPEQASYLNYDALSPARQQALTAAMQQLSPAAQRAAAEAYRGQGLTAAERLLGVAPTRYEELAPSLQATTMERYRGLTPAQQDIAAQLYQRGGMAGVEPFLRADLANMTYDQIQELLLQTASSRQVKRDVAPAREKTLRDVLPGGGSPIPPAPVGALANRLGTLHGAVRALGRDVQALKGRR
jgi:hypothetical protein